MQGQGGSTLDHSSDADNFLARTMAATPRGAGMPCTFFPLPVLELSCGPLTRTQQYADAKGRRTEALDTEPASVAAALTAAINAHDVEGALACFAENAVLHTPERGFWQAHRERPATRLAPGCCRPQHFGRNRRFSACAGWVYRSRAGNCY